MRYQFIYKAPKKLLDLDGHCGPLSVWMILQNQGKNQSSENIINDCYYSEKEGVFTIGIALAFKKWGFNVIFHTLDDPDIHPDEIGLYTKVKNLGLLIKPAIGIVDLIELLENGEHLIVFYDIGQDEGHFSPIESVDYGKLQLSLHNNETIATSDFIKRWNRPGFPMQVVRINGFQQSARTVRPLKPSVGQAKQQNVIVCYWVELKNKIKRNE